jgi:hypothetical protein
MRFLWAALGLLACGAAFALAGEPKPHPDGAKHPVTVRVLAERGGLGAGKDEIWIQPMHASQFTVRIIEGVAPGKGEVLPCQQKQEIHTATKNGVEFRYPAVVLNCPDGLRLVLSGISL